MADSIDSDRVHRTTATWRVPSMDGDSALAPDDAPVGVDDPVPTTTIEWVVATDPSRSARRARVIAVTLTPDAPLKSVRAQIILARLEGLGTVQGTEPPVQTVSDLFDGEFTIVLETSADDAVIETAVRSAGDVARVIVRDPVARRATKDVLRNVRIDLKRLDALLDLVGELVITRDRLLAVAEASGDRTVLATAQETSRLISSLQEQILQARMVPVGQVFDRFPRMVRDVARDLGKEVSFTMEGRDIALDRSMLDAIGDPIVHLLRNAMDHGIESAEQRAAAGKPAAGRLVLRAVRDRAAIVIAVEDDGRGIDRARVMSRAIAEGRIDRHVSTLSDDDLIKLLAQPGFSTAESVTAVSGRGVGIDVVANRVRTLGGSMDIETIPGRGTVFSLRLPVTLAIVRALLVQVADRTYAVPSAHVIEAVEFDEAARLTLRGREAVSLRDEVLPLVRLRRVFGEPVTDDVDAQLLVVDAGGRRFACKVDALLGQQDIVVKAFDSVVGAEALFSGATILGDGSPALIVDVGSLA
jgi:two-component system chemotaxis sensor kinase CheA